MPVLPNSKHERFVHALASGLSAREAVVESGLEPGDWRESQGFYVYALIDPRDGMVFYVGKGKGNRCLAHEKDVRALRIVNPAKHSKIAEIVGSGKAIEILCVADSLSEHMAFWIERRLIAIVGREILTNATSGQRSTDERLLIQASDMAQRIMPFVEWLNKAKRSAQEISWYRQIADEIREFEANMRKRVFAPCDPRPIF